MPPKIQTIQKMNKEREGQSNSQTVTERDHFKSEGHTLGGEKAQAASKQNVAPKQAGQVGDNIQSNVLFGGNQEAGKIKFGQLKEGIEGKQAPSADVPNLKPIQTGNNTLSNVLHPDTTQKVEELTFG